MKRLMLAVVFAACGALPLFAADAPKSTPETEAMMKKAMTLGAPGVNHKALDPLIGKWTAHIKNWMKPGDKAMETEGTGENTWILGGRYVQQKFNATWNGQPFEGLGFMGFDNIRGEHQNVWLDSAATGMMMGTGLFDAKAKAVKLSGEYSCPMTGEARRPYKAEWKIDNNDTHQYLAYDKGPDGKEFKSMEITFKRVK